MMCRTRTAPSGFFVVVAIIAGFQPGHAFAQSNGEGPGESKPETSAVESGEIEDESENAQGAAEEQSIAGQQDESAAEMEALRAQMRELQKQLVLTQEIVRESAKAQPAPPAVPVEPQKPHATVLKQGAYYVGGTMGVSFNGKDNIGTLFGTVDEGTGFKADVAGVFGRVLLEDNLGLGLTVRYKPENKKVTSAGSSSEPSKTTESAEYSLTGGPALRQYLPIVGDSLFVYYQAAVTFGYAEQVQRTFQGDTSSVVSANGYSLGLDVQPGLMIAASDSFTIEVGVNVLGLEYTHFKSTTDYETVGTEHKGAFTADVNLLSLQFSFVGYF